MCQSDYEAISSLLLSLSFEFVKRLYRKRRIYPLRAGGRLNKKDGLTRYGNSHVKDKTS